MNKETKKVMQENNELEKKMSKKSNEIFLNMIVYLRGSDITEYNQEKVRRDIIDMIIEGEERGDDIDTIIGKDYKKLCDEIISVFPQKNAKQKLIDLIEIALSCIYILGLISVIKIVTINLIKKHDILKYSLSIGDILNAFVIFTLAIVIVNVICKNSFKKPEINNKVFSFFVTWLALMILFCGMIGIAYFLKFIVISTNIIYAVIFVIIAFIANKIISSRN